MENRSIYDEVYLLGESITTCPKCGARTDIIFDLSHSINGTQIHECLNEGCKKIFVTENDKELVLIQ